MKTCLISIAITALFPFALEAEPNRARDRAEAGRYDLSFSTDGTYFLDTKTGELWLKDSSGDWERVDSPVVRAPSDPPEKKEKKEKKVDKPVKLALPKGGVAMPMVQRERRAIPHSSDTLSVQLGDITGAQVFVEVIDINGRYLAERTSLRNGTGRGEAGVKKADLGGDG